MHASVPDGCAADILRDFHTTLIRTTGSHVTRSNPAKNAPTRTHAPECTPATARHDAAMCTGLLDGRRSTYHQFYSYHHYHYHYYHHHHHRRVVGITVPMQSDRPTDCLRLVVARSARSADRCSAPTAPPRSAHFDCHDAVARITRASLFLPRASACVLTTPPHKFTIDPALVAHVLVPSCRRLAQPPAIVYTCNSSVTVDRSRRRIRT